MDVHAARAIDRLGLALAAMVGSITACGDGLNVGAINLQEPKLGARVSKADASVDASPDRTRPDTFPPDGPSDVGADRAPDLAADLPPDLYTSPDLALVPDAGSAVPGANGCAYPACFRDLLNSMRECPQEGACVEQTVQSTTLERHRCFQNGTRVSERPLERPGGLAYAGIVSRGGNDCFTYEERRGPMNEAVFQYTDAENVTTIADVTVFTDGSANLLCPGDTVRSFPGTCKIPALLGLDPPPSCTAGVCQ